MNESVDHYADIIHLQAPRPTNRLPMPLQDRAAQFSAFAALTGHAAAIHETARLTEHRPELSECAKAELDAQLRKLLQRTPSVAEITWFEPDPHKAGGACLTSTCRIHKFDAAQRCLLLADGRRLPLDNILALELE